MYKILKTFIVLVTVWMPTLLNAQTTPPPPGGAPGGFPIPGLVYAIFVAIGYGIYKHINNPKK